MNPELKNVIEDLKTAYLGLHRLVRGTDTEPGADYMSDEYRDSVKKAVEAIHPPEMKLRLEKVSEPAPGTKSFVFSRIGEAFPPFEAGQYINLHVKIGGILTSRPFSISSAPSPDSIEITIKEKAGGFVSAFMIREAKPGDAFVSSGPAGHFRYEPLIDRGELVFLAGGSGITPFMAMVRDFARKGWPAKVTLVYGAKNLDDAIFHRELTKLSSRNERFSYTLILSEPAGEWVGKTGFITGSRILEAAGGIENRTFFICGPQAMYDFCIPELKRIKAPRHRIRRELYGPPSPITSSPGWPVTIPAEKRFSVSVDGRRTFDAAAGEPLLNSLEREGIAAPALCRSGECSNCRVKLLSGRVYQPPQALVRQSDRECGYIHTCVAYPVSDLVIRI